MPLFDASYDGQPGLTYVGYNVAGGSTAVASNSTITHVYKQFVLSSTKLMLSMDVYCKGDGSHVISFFGAVHLDSSGAPGDVVCQGNFGGNGTGGGIVINTLFGTTPMWRSIPMGCVLAAGTYWLHFAYGGSSTGTAFTFYYDSVTPSDIGGTDNNTWLNPGSGGTSSLSKCLSIRGTMLG